MKKCGSREKLKLVGNHIINQHQPAVPQASITEELDSWDEIPESTSVYAYM